MSNKILIIGLGNPDKKYKETPHNVGYKTIDKLIAQISNDQFLISKEEKRFAVVWRIKINEKKILIIKPLLFMNHSGEALKKLLTAYDLQLTAYSLFIVHDDIDLQLGEIKISKGATSSGHKGVQNIIDEIHPKNMTRIRIGIRLPNMPAKRSPEKMSKFVTKKLSGKNKKVLEEASLQASEKIFELMQNT